jgi:predicted AlkP superfamily pyrophosphatase or phosphodiesterase
MTSMRLLVFLVLAGCGSSHAVPPASHARELEARPKLVVLVVVDQLASWTFAKYLPHLPESGFFRRAVENGAVFHADYAYAATYTAAGHTSIATGTTPSVHGVSANEIRRDGHEVGVLDDREHAILGAEDENASPSVVAVPTVADALHAQTDGDAVIVSLSFKARAAIPLAGSHPDAALFYEKSAHGITTSSFYGERVPEWASSWLATHPIDACFGEWTPLDAVRYGSLLGPDDAPGEANYRELGTTFPHTPSESTDPYATVRVVPASTDYLLELAAHSVETLHMGEDAVPDLLAISISTIDYVGHFFGPDSWEYFDALLRLDRALSTFYDRLAGRTDVAFVLTSDHGVAPLPERETFVHARLERDVVATAAERAAAERLGEGPWIDAFLPPYVYFTPAGRERRAELVPLVVAALDRTPGVMRAFDVRNAAALRADRDPILRSVGLSIPPEPPGEVMVFPAEGFIVGEVETRGFGTTHGSPYPYDRRVPVIALGTSVEAMMALEPTDQRRVAPTIALLLGIDPPSAATEPPLPILRAR